MIINPVRLQLPTKVINTAVLSGTSLKLHQQVEPAVFHSVYKNQITQPGLTEEKAFYLACQHRHVLPAIQALLLRNLRS